MTWNSPLLHLLRGPHRRRGAAGPGLGRAFGSAGRGLSSLLLALLVRVSASAQDRVEIVNQSAQPWTLALVEGSRPRAGTLTGVDKFTGTTLFTLTKAGDSATLPPNTRTLLVFHRKAGYLYQGFILKDHLGSYAEYVASLEFLTSRTISLQLVSHHVGTPLDREDDGAIAEFLANAIEIGERTITIRPNSLEFVPAAGRWEETRSAARTGSRPPPGPDLPR